MDGRLLNFDKDELGEFADEYTGYGVETKVYVMDSPSMFYCVRSGTDFEDDGVIIITVKNTYIGKVDNVNERKNTFDIVTKLGNTIASGVKGNADFGFEDGDMVLYWVCSGEMFAAGYDFGKNDVAHKTVDAHDFGEANNFGVKGDIHDVQLVEPSKQYVSYARYVNDRTENYRFSESYFTADGKNVNYDRNFGHYYDMNADIMDDAQVKEEWNVYYDLFGYAMYYEVPGDDTEYEYAYFVEDTWKGKFVETSQSGAVWSYTADYVDFSAKKANGAINETLKDEMSDAYENPGVIWGHDFWPDFDRGAGLLAKYHVDEDGTMIWDRTANILFGSDLTMQLEAGNFVIADVREEFDAPLYAGAATKFLVRTFNYTTGEYEYTSFTGYKNIDKDYGTELYFFQSYLQYFDENNDNIAEYVFIDAVYTSNDSLFYLMGKAHNATWDKLKDYYPDYDVYYALVDGKPAFVAFKEVAGGDGVEGGNRNPAGYAAYGLYEGTMSVLNADVGEVEGADGESCPLYVAIDPVRADYRGAAAQAINIWYDETNQLIGFEWPVDFDGPAYMAPAENFVLHNIVYGHAGYNSDVNEGYKIKDYPLENRGRIWIVTNADDEVTAIYREVV